MIERDTANELRGQMDLSDVMGIEGTGIEGTGNRGQGTGNRGQGTGMAEGYDAEGNLLDVEPTPKPSPMGKVAPASPGSDEVASNSTLHTPHSTPPDSPLSTLHSPLSSDRLDILAAEINAITAHARVVLASAAIDIGNRLIEARQLVPRGRWGEWLSANVDYSERKAQQLMQLAEEYGRGALPSGDALGLSHMTALLAAPEEEREALAQRAVDEGLSVRQLQDEIANLKAQRDDAQLSIDALNAELTDTRRALEDTEAARDDAREEKLTAQRDIEAEREAARLATARAEAAEASMAQLRQASSKFADDAAASDQRARDAVERANQTARELTGAKATIAKLESMLAEAEAKAEGTGEAEARTVEVIPEEVRRELADLRAQLAEAKAAQAPQKSLPLEGKVPPKGADEVSATEKFKWFYNNQMKPAFHTAVELLKEVAAEDTQAANTYATVLVKGCNMLAAQLGE